MFSELAEQKNLYATQKNVKSINAEANELKQLIGAYLRMCLVKMPNQRSYWETFYGYSSISSIFSRKRFETLMSSIQFVNNNGVTEKTKKKLTDYGNCVHGIPICEEISLEKFTADAEIMVPIKNKSTLL